MPTEAGGAFQETNPQKMMLTLLPACWWLFRQKNDLSTTVKTRWHVWCVLVWWCRVRGSHQNKLFPCGPDTRRVLCEWTQVPLSIGCTRNLRVTPAAPDSSDKVTCTPWLVLSWLSLLVDQSSATSPFTLSFRDYTQSCCCCVWVFSFTRCKMHIIIL